MSCSLPPETHHAALAQQQQQQQQTIINQQAIIMVKPPSPLSVCSSPVKKQKKTLTIKDGFILPSQAQQMTMQAMAMSSTPVSSPPTSPITSPPTSPLLPHLVSPYAVLPPSPYANMPPSPYANFSPNPYATAGLPPSPYAPTDEPAGQPQPDPDPGSSSANAAASRPEVSAAAQVSASCVREGKDRSDILCNSTDLFKSRKDRRNQRLAVVTIRYDRLRVQGPVCKI